MKRKILIGMLIILILSIIVTSASISSSLSSKQQEVLDKKNTTTEELGIKEIDNIRKDIINDDLNRIKRLVLRMDLDNAEIQVEKIKQTFNKSCSITCK